MGDGLDRVVQETVRDLLGRVVVIRLTLVPVLSGVLATAVALDPQPWRVAFGAALVGVLVTLSVVEYLRWRKGWAGDGALPMNVVAMLWVQLGGIALTGGLQSPLLPVLPMATLQTAVGFGRTWPVWLVAGAQIAAVWGFAAAIATGHSPALPMFTTPSAGASAASAALFSGIVLVGVFVGSQVRATFAVAISRALDAEEAERQAHAEHAREIAAMSAEIAHELKNPLASIKGLGALLAKDLQGRDAERLSVLRGEVDRMQERIDAFLTASRPVVPLSWVEVDLGGLCADVAAISEGLARAAQVRLRVEGRGTGRADRRKLRQVLVNLVQNAIEASPEGGEVELRVDVDGGQARIAVLDRGTGPGEAPERWFEAGHTSKEQGNGLGLTIARALMTQHGGTLSLSSRPGGGTAAVLTLPVAGVGAG